MGWIYVLIASSLEISGVIGLKLFSQKKNLPNLVLFASGFALSYLFLYFALDYLDMSIAYAVWMGLGTAGAVIVNMMFFGGEPKALENHQRHPDYCRCGRVENGFLTDGRQAQKLNISPTFISQG